MTNKHWHFMQIWMWVYFKNGRFLLRMDHVLWVVYVSHGRPVFSDPVLNRNPPWMLTSFRSTKRPWLVSINLFHAINIFEFPISTAAFFASTVECLRDLIFYFLHCSLRHNLSGVVRKIAVHKVSTHTKCTLHIRITIKYYIEWK